MLGNCQHPDRYFTCNEVDFFNAFWRKYAAGNAKELKKGIIRLPTRPPYRQRRRELDRAYNAKRRQLPARKQGRPANWTKLRRVAVILTRHPNLSYDAIKRFAPCCGTTIWKVKKMLARGIFDRQALATGEI